jgi:hypothetical protein
VFVPLCSSSGRHCGCSCTDIGSKGEKRRGAGAGASNRITGCKTKLKRKQCRAEECRSSLKQRFLIILGPVVARELLCSITNGGAQPTHTTWIVHSMFTLMYIRLIHLDI